jgi:hypothetical protein
MKVFKDFSELPGVCNAAGYDHTCFNMSPTKTTPRRNLDWLKNNFAHCKLVDTVTSGYTNENGELQTELFYQDRKTGEYFVLDRFFKDRAESDAFQAALQQETQNR